MNGPLLYTALAAPSSTCNCSLSSQCFSNVTVPNVFVQKTRYISTRCILHLEHTCTCNFKIGAAMQIQFIRSVKYRSGKKVSECSQCVSQSVGMNYHSVNYHPGLRCNEGSFLPFTFDPNCGLLTNTLLLTS